VDDRIAVKHVELLSDDWGILKTDLATNSEAEEGKVDGRGKSRRV
jgi:hypothetical protein